jgi:uncharacterized alkaline shock family protein YloU
MAQVWLKDPTLGGDVRYEGDAITIDLYIVVEYWYPHQIRRRQCR